MRKLVLIAISLVFLIANTSMSMAQSCSYWDGLCRQDVSRGKTGWTPAICNQAVAQCRSNCRKGIMIYPGLVSGRKWPITSCD